MRTFSPTALQAPAFKQWRPRTAKVYGLAVHTTGSGIVQQADKLKLDVLAHAVAYYVKPDSYGPHYVIGYDGRIVQVADEAGRASHIGWKNEEERVEQRKWCMAGTWRDHLSKACVAAWDARWPDIQSPAHLYPGTSPNNVYVGVELLPMRKARANGLLFTDEQHGAVVRLARDVASRWGWPKGWHLTGRLVGHEDVTPFTRSNQGGGWDPGALRVVPAFSWDNVRSGIEVGSF